MKRKIIKEEEILRKANSKGRGIPRRGKRRDEKWENIEGGKVLREEKRKNTQGGEEKEILREERRRKYSGRKGGGKILREERRRKAVPQVKGRE